MLLHFGLLYVRTYVSVLLQTTSSVDSTPTSSSGPQDIQNTEGDIDGDSSSQPVPPGPSLLASPVFPVAAVLVIVFVAFLLAIITMLIIRKCLVVSMCVDKFEM